MKKNKLGEFEEIVMLTVGILHGNAYGVTIKKEIESRADRKVSVGALQTALKRLEQKGYLQAERGEGSQERAGRPKRFYTVTAHGRTALAHNRDLRNELWAAMSKTILDLKIAQ